MKCEFCWTKCRFRLSATSTWPLAVISVRGLGVLSDNPFTVFGLRHM